MLGKFLEWRRKRLGAEKALVAKWDEDWRLRQEAEAAAKAADEAKQAAEDQLMDSLRQRALTDSAAAVAYSTIYKARAEAKARIKAAYIEADARITAAANASCHDDC